MEQVNGVGHGWMAVPPLEALHTVIDPADYRLGLKWWLGLPLADTPSTCAGCQATADVHGDHDLCCIRNNFANRHNAVQDALFNLLSTNGQSVQREVPVPNQPDSSLRPADLLLATWQDGKPTAVDITIAHGWQTAERLATRERWRTFLKRKETAKHAKYDIPCRNGGWSFATLAMGTWGGLGPESATLLTRMVKRTTSWDQGDIRSSRQAESYQLLALALFRQIVQMLRPKHILRQQRQAASHLTKRSTPLAASPADKGTGHHEAKPIVALHVPGTDTGTS
jgi:hypothetical protein